MQTTTCLDCGTRDVQPGTFCPRCGKAIRLVVAQEGSTPFTATLPAGVHTISLRDLRRTAAQVLWPLLASAVLSFYSGAGDYSARRALAAIPLSGDSDHLSLAVIIVAFAAGAVLVGLAALSWWSASPASILGLCTFVIFALADTALASAMSPILLTKGIFLKIAGILLLVWAVVSGMKHARLKATLAKQPGGTGPASPT